MIFRFVVLLLLATQLISCTSLAIKENKPFDLVGRDYLYQKTEWSFAGRLAISDAVQSLTATIHWVHHHNHDDIELSGIFGMGRTFIELSDGQMIVDDGEQKIKYLGKGDDSVAELLGVNVPIHALKFWVRGLTFPEKDYLGIKNGFLQNEWQVRYSQMQTIGQHELPRKIRVENKKVKLKLIVNQWQM
ncbi:MAG: outer membrane lipoprotein LolB [Methylococcales symbiont of Hymedesmia sp. n. MRB-2018]|nr:MAG: outer membrane lipoprotein LolB [Methylococcales symbiont of Hymedesmia sp. n. MRB-2018]KAF3982801.1 MAG: outer membrane lipoprotein LolB [Methylococcales symbiont of Hymedesmia sp. n. MRB-2018]